MELIPEPSKWYTKTIFSEDISYKSAGDEATDNEVLEDQIAAPFASYFCILTTELDVFNQAITVFPEAKGNTLTASAFGLETLQSTKPSRPTLNTKPVSFPVPVTPT